MSDLERKFTYGYYILTALKKGENLKSRDEDYIAAGTVNWVTQVSFSPVIVSVAVGQQSELNETIDYSQQFTLHLISEDQKEWITKFGRKSTIEDGKINGVPFQKENDQAILKDSMGFLSCKVVESLNMGDHTVYFVEVIFEQSNKNQEPLCTMQLPSEYTKGKAVI